MNRTIIILALIFSITMKLNAQYFDYLNYSKEEIIDEINEDLDSSELSFNLKPDTVYQPKIDGMLVELDEDEQMARDFNIILKKNQLDSVEFFFKRPYVICDSIVLNFCCDSCAYTNWLEYKKVSFYQPMTIHSRKFYCKNKKLIFKDPNSYPMNIGIPFFELCKKESGSQIKIYFKMVTKKTWREMRKVKSTKKT